MTGAGWANGPVIGFDTETTGVNVGTDRLVTAAVVHRDATGTSVRTWLANPGVPIPAGATAIHHISTEQATAEGEPARDVLASVSDALVDGLSAGVLIVAFNAAFDLQLIEAELRRHGLATLHDRLNGDVAPVLDPLVIDRAVEPYRKGPRRLGTLCQVYGVATGELHDAAADVVATLDLLLAMIAAHPQLAALGLDGLHAAQVDAHRQWALEYNDWQARKAPDRTPAELGWPFAASTAPAGAASGLRRG